MITQLSRILSPARCLAKVSADSRKRVLENVSRVCAAELNDVAPMNIFDLFVARERLGSTAMGHGVAIPHVRFTDIEQPMAVLLQLTKPIAYEARDGFPVDLFFALLVPDSAQDEHIKILSQTALMLSNESTRNALRRADDSQTLYQLVLDYERQQLASDDTLPGLDGDDDELV